MNTFYHIDIGTRWKRKKGKRKVDKEEKEETGLLGKKKERKNCGSRKQEKWGKFTERERKKEILGINKIEEKAKEGE